VPPATVAQVVAMTCSEPPGEAAHWTGRAMAKAVGLSLRGLKEVRRPHLTAGAVTKRQRIAVEIYENVGGVRAIDHLGGDAL
jgi:hypothetical protein